MDRITRRKALMGGAGLAALGALGARAARADDMPPGFRRVATQYIASLAGDNEASGGGAQTWGLWRQDPGPRGVWLRLFPAVQAAGGLTLAGWRFEAKDWWMEEHGLIMESPEFPLPPGRYLVTGGREATTVLTVAPPDANGDQHWDLANGVTIGEVTHLACRSARYTPETADGTCSPAQANKAAFPVMPGGTMPSVPGCTKRDYAVLFVIGVEDSAAS